MNQPTRTFCDPSSSFERRAERIVYRGLAKGDTDDRRFAHQEARVERGSRDHLADRSELEQPFLVEVVRWVHRFVEGGSLQRPGRADESVPMGREDLGQRGVISQRLAILTRAPAGKARLEPGGGVREVVDVQE